MKKKKVAKLINEILDEELAYQDGYNRIIIVRPITKKWGFALYYNQSNGEIIRRPIEWNNLAAYEDEKWKLFRFTPDYIKAAKNIALIYMGKHSMGYGLYFENGIVVG